MRLIIKQKVFSWTDRFRVWDEDDHDRYYVEGELFSFGKKLHVVDPDGREVALVQQKVFSFLPRFFVWVDGVQVAEIVKEFTFFHPRYTIGGLGWDIEGISSGTTIPSHRKGESSASRDRDKGRKMRSCRSGLPLRFHLGWHSKILANFPKPVFISKFRDFLAICHIRDDATG
jgi:hypothetical protein